MLQSVISNNKWMLQDDGLILLSHTAEQPFVTTLKREKVYEVNRGTVKEQVVERDQIPLTTLEQTAEGLCLSAEGHRLEIKLVPRPLCMELRLTGEPGWLLASPCPQSRRKPSSAAANSTGRLISGARRSSISSPSISKPPQ